MNARASAILRNRPAGLAAGFALTAGLAALTLYGDHAAKPGAPQQAVSRLLATLQSPAGGGAEAPAAAAIPLTALHGDGTIRHLGAPAGQSFTVAPEAGSAEAAARRFLKDHAEALGIPLKGVDFTVVRHRRQGVRHYLKFAQTFAGLPVFAGSAIVQLGADNGVEYTGNYLARDLDPASLDPAPSLSAAAAADSAKVRFLPEARGGALLISPPELIWFVPSLLSQPGAPELAWQVGVRAANPLDVNDLVFLSARTGEVLHRLSYTCAGLHRTVFDANNDSNWPSPPPAPPPIPRRVEGSPSSSIGEVNAAYDLIGQCYNFYSNKHGRDGIGNSGKPLFAVTRRCSDSLGCPMANAYWSGLPVASFPGIPGFSIDEGNLNFGDGYVKDDVTAHEYTHGVTQYESGLIYQNASGAINEAFSDIWGEFLDWSNGSGNDSTGVQWDMGEDLPGGRIRSMSNPPAFNHPDRLGSTLFVNATSDPNGGNDRGGVHSNSGIINKLCYLLTAGGSFNGHTISGMGMDPVLRLFYEVNTNLLGSSADYCDLSAALHQAASNLGWNSGEVSNLHAATLAVEIVGNWVDRSNGNGSPNGCRRPGAGTGGPFRTVTQGVAPLRNGDPLFIAAGSYDESIRITKPMKIRAWNGTVTIGR